MSRGQYSECLLVFFRFVMGVLVQDIETLVSLGRGTSDAAHRAAERRGRGQRGSGRGQLRGAQRHQRRLRADAPTACTWYV